MPVDCPQILTRRIPCQTKKINVDSEPELAEAFGVSSIPMLVVMKGGKIVNQSVGARPKAQILDMLKDHLAYRLEKYTLGMESSEEKLTISEAIANYDLSKREAIVLKELMSGKENTVICEELFITTNTLKKHILNIYRKLGIKNRVQLFKMIKEKE